jgi:S1-C subfamily serine protease
MMGGIREGVVALQIKVLLASASLILAAPITSAQVLETDRSGVYSVPFDEIRGVHTYAEMVRSARRSVVRINTLRASESGSERRSASVGNGTGIVVDAPAGLILTNHHVIENADFIFIESLEGGQIEARLLGFDTATDLALIQADLPGVETATFGDSALVETGDLVFAIGYPRGLDQTLSMGVVSGAGRQGFRNTSTDNIGVDDFLQTDAAINPGNSGGPLVDSAGRVIGVNTFIISANRQSTGLSFAVPSRVAMTVVQQLREHGRMRRTWLGIFGENLERNSQAARNAGVDTGVKVTAIEPGSPASVAGLLAGDIIVGAGTVRIDGLRDLFNFWLLAEPERAYPIFIRRSTDALRLSLFPVPIEQSGRATAASGLSLLGAQFADTPVSLTGTGPRGARVAALEPGGSSTRRGLQIGDVVVEANASPVDSAEALKSIADRAEGGILVLRVRRNGAEVVLLISTASASARRN